MIEEAQMHASISGGRMTWWKDPDEIAREVMGDSLDNVVVVTPVVVRADVPRPYFMLAFNDPDGFGVVEIEVEDGNADRAEVIAAIARFFAAQHRISVIHDVGDELQAARLCEQLWPCALTEKIRRGIEQESAPS